MIILFLDGVIRLSGWASPSTTRCFCTDGRVLAVFLVSDNSRAQRKTFSCGRWRWPQTPRARAPRGTASPPRHGPVSRILRVLSTGAERNSGGTVLQPRGLLCGVPPFLVQRTLHGGHEPRVHLQQFQTRPRPILSWPWGVPGVLNDDRALFRDGKGRKE